MARQVLTPDLEQGVVARCLCVAGSVTWRARDLPVSWWLTDTAELKQVRPAINGDAAIRRQRPVRVYGDNGPLTFRVADNLATVISSPSVNLLIPRPPALLFADAVCARSGTGRVPVLDAEERALVPR